MDDQDTQSDVDGRPDRWYGSRLMEVMAAMAPATMLTQRGICHPCTTSSRVRIRGVPDDQEDPAVRLQAASANPFSRFCDRTPWYLIGQNGVEDPLTPDTPSTMTENTIHRWPRSSLLHPSPQPVAGAGRPRHRKLGHRPLRCRGIPPYWHRRGRGDPVGLCGRTVRDDRGGRASFRGRRGPHPRAGLGVHCPGALTSVPVPSEGRSQTRPVVEARQFAETEHPRDVYDRDSRTG